LAEATETAAERHDVGHAIDAARDRRVCTSRGELAAAVALLSLLWIARDAKSMVELMRIARVVAKLIVGDESTMDSLAMVRWRRASQD
jgi:hypothetical protein